MKTLLTYLLASALTLTCFGSVSAGIKTLALNNFTLDNVLADTLAIFSFTDVALPKTTEETYVDDIPFDTWAVSAEYFVSILPKPDEELPFDDFPFDTKTIADRYLNRILPEIAPEPESYIDDIPFDTTQIARQYLDCNFSAKSGPDTES